MVSALAIAGLAVLVGVHTLAAAVLTRLLRVRLSTRLSAAVYTAFLVPLVLLLSTLVLTGLFGLGPDLGSPATALFLMIGVPFVLGITIDVVWMPDPDEVDLPEAT